MARKYLTRRLLSDTESKNCERCGEPFTPKFPTALLCYGGWLEREHAFERVGDLEREVQRLRTAAAPIPADIARLLVLLCHPDRHGNSVAANKATAWLLEQRRGA
jgi:hypothetical protein